MNLSIQDSYGLQKQLVNSPHKTTHRFENKASQVGKKKRATFPNPRGLRNFIGSESLFLSLHSVLGFFKLQLTNSILLDIDFAACTRKSNRNQQEIYGQNKNEKHAIINFQQMKIASFN